MRDPRPGECQSSVSGSNLSCCLRMRQSCSGRCPFCSAPHFAVRSLPLQSSLIVSSFSQPLSALAFHHRLLKPSLAAVSSSLLLQLPLFVLLCSSRHSRLPLAIPFSSLTPQIRLLLPFFAVAPCSHRAPRPVAPRAFLKSIAPDWRCRCPLFDDWRCCMFIPKWEGRSTWGVGGQGFACGSSSLCPGFV